jgi:short-subunit dehydrogenase
VEIQGKTVLITGASSGIGAATAKAAARKGARVILLARNRSKLDSVVDEITAEGGDARAYEADCSNHEAVAEVASQIKSDFGTPDVIVNNAGAGRFLYFLETPVEEFEQMMAAPFFAAVYVTHAFLQDMVDRGSGLIVNVNAPISFVAWPAAAGYASTRWALRGLNDALSAELEGSGIKVCMVVPGKVWSDYFANNPGAEHGIPAISRIVRTLESEEVADVIVKTVASEKRVVFAPFMMRVMMLQARWFPRLWRWLAIKTSRPRAQPGSSPPS